MYPHLMTQDPKLSPLMGLLKIDQIAFLARNDEDERAIKKQLRLTNANWVEDEVVAKGYVQGARVPGTPRGPQTNRAKLLFNYDFGIELEILRYIDGPNYADQAGLKSCRICHIGAHVEKGKEIPPGLEAFVIPTSMAQEVTTQSHTNPFLIETGRRYRYSIYNTLDMLGMFFKVIERIG